MEKNGFISDCFVTYDLSIRPIWICEAGHLKSLISRWTILKQRGFKNIYQNHTQHLNDTVRLYLVSLTAYNLKRIIIIVSFRTIILIY